MKRKKPAITPLQKAGPLLRIASAALAAIGVFWLPWHVDSMTPAVGESYLFGFNNRVAVLALGGAIFLGAAGCYFNSRRPNAYKWLHPLPKLFPPLKEAPVEYGILIFICACMSAILIFWSSYLVDPAWCEARGFIY